MQLFLELDGSARQSVGVVEPLGALGPIRQRHDEGKPVPFDLMPDLAAQVLSLSFVEPNHDRDEAIIGPAPGLPP